MSVPGSGMSVPGFRISAHGMFATTRQVVTQEGVAGLWRGLVPSLARTVPGIGIYFSCMEWLCSSFCNGGRPSDGQALLIGATSRCVAGTAVIPVTVIKTRVEAGQFQYRGLRHALQALHLQEGVRGLCSGLVPTLLRDAPFSGLYLMFYEKLKSSCPPGVMTSTPALSLFTCGVMAGVLACVVTHPADVVKTKVQLDSKVTVTKVVGWVYREGGVKGFMVGFVPRMVRRTMMTALSWTLYETLMKKMKLK